MMPGSAWLTLDGEHPGGVRTARQPRVWALSLARGGAPTPALSAADPELHALLEGEERYQRDTIRLIASENYVSRAALEASGSVLTNEYSEGYPGARFYQGQRQADAVEQLAIARAKALFGAEHVNVQPHSGSPANLAVYLAFLQPGDTILGLDLPHGRHLTHGTRASISGGYFRSVAYQLDPRSCLLGTPVVTSRGFGPEELEQVAAWIDRAIRGAGDGAELDRIAGEVTALCRRFPAPGLC